ncbi:MAG: DNA polymerase Y family protein [Burkholderiales bacterium]
MLWLALRFPRLVLEVLSRGRAPLETERAPWAVADAGRVLACDARAEALGVRPGMRLAAAWALASQLHVWPSNQAAKQETLEGIAAWMCRFTPRVSLQMPNGVLAEIEGSLRLFHGLATMVEQIRAGVDQMGLTPTLAVAPTARGAWWLASAGQEALILDRAVLEMALASLPIAVACDRPDALDLLHNIGITTIGELRGLPREGVARRFGQALLDGLDQALGRVPEPRNFFAPPLRFAAKLELPGEVTHAEGVLFAVRRLLVQLEGLLTARQAGVRRFLLTLLHRNVNPTVLDLGLASPCREVERFMQLLRERLSAHRLVKPVEAIRIEAENFVPLHAGTVDLFKGSHAESEAWARLVERLQARLGSEAVHGLGLHPEHRPERAWRAIAAEDRPLCADQSSGARPLWLIEPPRRLKEKGGVPLDAGPLELLAGPERIESGWWDEGEIARDYFIARAPSAALLWVFRERGTTGGWYLHGMFA